MLIEHEKMPMNMIRYKIEITEIGEKKSETKFSASNIEFPTVIDVIFSITYIVRVNAK